MRDGCIAGDTFTGCYDEDPCTMDVCVEGEPGMSYHCLHPPLDRDEDGHVDDHCGGADCDDLDPHVHPGAVERCFDEADNDCDGDIDGEDIEDCTLQNDTCETARELVFENTADGRRCTAEGFTMGAEADIDGGCDSSTNPDVAYTFTLEEDSDVELLITGHDDFFPWASVQTECGVADASVYCEGDSPLRACLPALEAGSYALVVSSWEEGVFDFRIDAREPAGPLAGDDCNDPVDVTGGGSFVADLFCAGDDEVLSCASWADHKDLVYAFTLDEPQDVSVRASSPISYVYVSLMTECGDTASALDCGSDYPFERTYGALAAGTYYLIVESWTPTEFNLLVDFAPASDPPPNDTCATAIDVSSGGAFEGSLVSAGDDGSSSCRPGEHLDAAYELTLEETQNVEIVVDGAGGYEAYFSLQAECGNPDTDVACVETSPARKTFYSLPAGTYAILVESEHEGRFDMEVTFGPPTSACEDAVVIDAPGTYTADTGGRPSDFSPTCSGGDGPDLPLLLRLAEDSDVSLEITSSDLGDPILSLLDTCDDDPEAVLACDDDGGSGMLPLLTARGVPAGDHYLIVDSYYGWDDGISTIQVDISASTADLADVIDVTDAADVTDVTDAADEADGPDAADAPEG
jgi:hypothetical protein